MNWWTHLSWAHALILLCLAWLGFIVWFVYGLSRTKARLQGNYRLRDPDRAIVPNRTFYISHWNRSVGKAYRERQ